LVPLLRSHNSESSKSAFEELEARLKRDSSNFVNPLTSKREA